MRLVEDERVKTGWADRQEAGRALGVALRAYKGKDVVVIGLPRGGVVVAAEVARALGAPLDVRIARKIGAPGQPELALGAVTADGHRVLHDALLRHFLLPPGWLAEATQAARDAAKERERRLRGQRSAEPLAGRTVLLVDDGIATGMTVRAAVDAILDEAPASLVVAAPVIAPDAYADLAQRVERVVPLLVPDDFIAVGQFYRRFDQTEDDEVQALLAAAPRA